MIETSYKYKRYGLIILGALLSVFSLIYVFKDILISELLASFNRISLLPLLASVLLYWGGLVSIRAVLVRYLLKKNSKLPFSRVYRCLCIGFFANNVLPFRMGDLARSMVLARAAGGGIPTILGALALERMLDFFITALIAFAAILTVDSVPSAIQQTAVWAASILAVVFVILILISKNQNNQVSHKTGIFAFLYNTWLKFSKGFEVLSSNKGIIVIVLLGISLWSVGVVSMVFRLASFDLPATIPNALLLFACLGFGVALPSAPGYVGVYQIAVVVALSTIGVPESISVGFALFTWAVDIIIGNLLGIGSMFLEGISFKELKKATKINS